MVLVPRRLLQELPSTTTEGLSEGHRVALQSVMRALQINAPDPSRVSKWVPTTDLMELRRFGKSLEELCELGAVMARCIIQGIDEVDPASGKVNRQRLEEETADVYAQLAENMDRFGLDAQTMGLREIKKRGYMQEWEKLFVVDDEAEKARKEKERTASRIAIVNTDNYGGDYPNESFVNVYVGTKETAQIIADALNRAAGPDSPRYFKVVEPGYKLAPGFEP